MRRFAARSQSPSKLSSPSPRKGLGLRFGPGQRARARARAAWRAPIVSLAPLTATCSVGAWLGCGLGVGIGVGRDPTHGKSMQCAATARLLHGRHGPPHAPVELGVAFGVARAVVSPLHGVVARNLATRLHADKHMLPSLRTKAAHQTRVVVEQILLHRGGTYAVHGAQAEEDGASRAWCALCGRRGAFGGAVVTARASQTITRSSYSSSVLMNNPDRSSRLEVERGEQQSISMGTPAPPATMRPWGRTKDSGNKVRTSPGKPHTAVRKPDHCCEDRSGWKKTLHSPLFVVRWKCHPRRRASCERRAAAAGWQVPAEPTMPRLNSQVLGF